MENIKQTIEKSKLIVAGDVVGVAVSGGEDSMALLHYLKDLAYDLDAEIVAIHVDHCIRENSSSDAEFVVSHCKQNGIRAYKFRVDAVKIARDKGISIEMGAREARYGVFDALIQKGVVNKIALAHHKSDQAETILLHLFRGSGLAGMKGMETIRDGVYIRPMLNTDKQAIKNYVFENDIPYVEDETNKDDTYQRNYIRNRILPQISKIWPNAVQSIINFSKDCVDADSYIQSQLYMDALMVEDKSVKIPASYFLYANALVSRMIFKALSLIGVNADVERKHIEMIKNLALYGENGKKLDLPNDLIVFKEYEYITIVNNYKEKPKLNLPFKCGEFYVEGFGKVKIKRIDPKEFKKEPNSIMIDAKQLPKGAAWRFREDGDVFEKYGGGTKKLKSYLADKKIPQRLRNILPVLAYESEIYAIAGVEISEAVRVEENVKTAYLITVVK